MNAPELIVQVLGVMLVICIGIPIFKKIFLFFFSSDVRRYAVEANRFLYRRDMISLIASISDLKKVMWKNRTAYRVSFDCARGNLAEILEGAASSVNLGSIVSEALRIYALRNYSNFEEECLIEQFDQDLIAMHIQISRGNHEGRKTVTLTFYERPVDSQYQP